MNITVISLYKLDNAITTAEAQKKFKISYFQLETRE